jgi:hypothetical protein
MLSHGFLASGDLPSAPLNFKCSGIYVRKFLKRTGLSFRHGQPIRRPALDKEECDDFILSIHISLEIFGREAVVNFDESSWRLVNAASRMVAEHGSESVTRFVNGDVKESVTFLASVTASGIKLPLILIAKGRTPR